MPAERRAAGSCSECGSPLASDQRYCLTCGARVGDRSPALLVLLSRARADGAPPPGPVDPVPAPAGAAARGLRLPSRPISALLLAGFLGFGILLGSVAAKPVTGTLAASRAPLRLVVPPSAPAPSAESGSASSQAEQSSEPPSSEPESTPAPASTAAASTKSSEGGSKPQSSGGSGSGGSGGSTANGPAKKLPPIKHVFMIVLSDQAYASAFGPSSPASYLTGTLEKRGELLVRYDAVAHEELANEIALLSGQGPTAETAQNCPTYTDIAPASSGAADQTLGAGCVYPSSTQTLPGQLTAKHLTWRAYVEGIDEGEALGGCARPVLGAADPSAQQTASTGPYATFRNPFVYFQSIVDSPACTADDVGIGKLASDLASAKGAPSLAYIVPDRCHDGNPTPCTAGAPAGMAPADTFLRRIVPKILASKSYTHGGLLIITVDEAPSTGEFADSSSCCGQPSFPNLPGLPTTALGRPRGGGAVGALLLSPYVKAATTSEEQFNHFSTLKTIEDLFSLAHVGYASVPGVKSFEPAMFTAKPSG